EKYSLITSEIHVPARISPQKAEEIKTTAKVIYKTLGCRGFARVDMFLKPSGEVVFNEVNTIPGFTAHSRYPSMMKAAGMTFTQVITSVIELAVGE
ncbi:MAG: ATP-grasp domain-containing protein, partial [Clostridiales bacterium]|nr:ATP-grasp domain-containing protein [Clostridiales bacterium]